MSEIQSFGRIYYLYVESPTGEELDLGEGFFAVDNALTEITENRITASVNFSAVSTTAKANSARITIFNLAEETIQLFRTKGVKVTLKAGYRTENADNELKDLPIIIRGEVTKTKISNNNVDKILELTITPLATERKTAIISKKFPQGTLLTEAIKQVCEPMIVGSNLTIDFNVGKSKENFILGRTKTFSASPFEALDEILNEHGLTGNFENEILRLRNKGTPTLVTSEIIEIDPTRIKGSLDLSTDFSKSEEGEGEGVEVDFTTFLDTRIHLNSNIQLTVNGSSGTYIVNSIGYRLDTHSNAWDVMVNASSISSSDT